MEANMVDLDQDEDNEACWRECDGDSWDHKYEGIASI
jgi:hypothetical protein